MVPSAQLGLEQCVQTKVNADLSGAFALANDFVSTTVYLGGAFIHWRSRASPVALRF